MTEMKAPRRGGRGAYESVVIAGQADREAHW